MKTFSSRPLEWLFTGICLIQACLILLPQSSYRMYGWSVFQRLMPETVLGVHWLLVFTLNFASLKLNRFPVFAQSVSAMWWVFIGMCAFLSDVHAHWPWQCLFFGFVHLVIAWRGVR